MRPISEVAADLGLRQEDLLPWGDNAAKLAPAVAFDTAPARGKLVLISAISPTPAGEGKTTVAIGLTQALHQQRQRAACALRQPSLGPVFGIKGGGTGGGHAQLVPAERINLHFTGDLHAVTAAHNLLAALVDNELYFDGPARLDSRQITLRRVLDMNDRFLRHTIIGLGGKTMGVPREDGFDITAASEVMAIVCLAESWADLKQRLGEILVGQTRDGTPVRARDLGGHGAMAALLRDALLPNLVQTIEGAPALVHGGPFGNIAHGCSSLVATRVGLRCADILVTEAGFGFDLGAEKFLDIKCRRGGLWPHAVVLVATVRALKFHGGAPAATLEQEDPAALEHGLANLDKHVENVRRFGLEPLIALNLHASDRESEISRVLAALAERNVAGTRVDVYARGGQGAHELAELLLQRLDTPPRSPQFLYTLAEPPSDKIAAVARAIYGAREVDYTAAAFSQLERAVSLGYGELPVCIAKTHLSLSDDEKLHGRPRDFPLRVRELRIAAGAGFLVPLTGEILTMPGLPRRPQALAIDLLPDGSIVGVR